MLTCFPKGFLNGTNILSTMLPPPIVCIFIDMAFLSLEQLSKAPRLHRGMGPLRILLQLSIKFLLISLQHFLKLNLICSAVTYVDLAVSALHLPDCTLCAPSISIQSKFSLQLGAWLSL